MSRKILFFSAAALILSLGVFLNWHFSTQNVMKRQLASFLSSMTFDANKGPVLRSFQTDKFSSHLAESVVISAPIERINRELSADAMRSGHSYLVTQAKYVSIQYDSIEVVSITDDAAVLSTILHIDTKVKHEPDHKMSLHSTFSFRKVAGNWKIHAINLQE